MLANYTKCVAILRTRSKILQVTIGFVVIVQCTSRIEQFNASAKNRNTLICLIDNAEEYQHKRKQVGLCLYRKYRNVYN